MNPQFPQPAQTQNPFLVPQVPTSGAPTTNSITPPPAGKKTHKALLVLLLLMVGVTSGLAIILRPVVFKSDAWNCAQYTFAFSDKGVVSVTNGESHGAAVQKANVYVNNNLVATYDVPALAAGESRTLGTVSVPQGSFSWIVQGTADCSNAGNVTEQVSYQCKNIKAYSVEGTELTAAALSNLAVGQVVRFVAVGTTNVIYQAARFSINGGAWVESTTKDTSGDYYTEYTILAGVTSVDVSAQVRGADGQWY